MSSFEKKELSWDTQYFGFNSLKVVLNRVMSKVDLSEIIEVASKYEFITIFL